MRLINRCIEARKDRKSVFRHYPPSEAFPNVGCRVTNTDGVIACNMGVATASQTNWYVGDTNNYVYGNGTSDSPQTFYQCPNLVYFPICTQGPSKQERIGDKVRLKFFNNKHRMNITWPDLEALTPQGEEHAIATKRLADLRQVKVYIYECMVSCKSATLLNPAEISSSFQVCNLNLTQTAKNLISRFQIWVANQPQIEASISTPTNASSDSFIDDVPSEKMWGTKLRKSEIDKYVLDQRAGHFSEGVKILKVHKISAPRRRLISMQDNSSDTVAAKENSFTFAEVEQTRALGFKTRSNKMFYYDDEGSRFPRNGMCYFQVLYINNPQGVDRNLLPYFAFRDGDLRVSWVDA